MRTLVLLLWLGCAAKNANPGAPEPSPAPMDAVLMRACDSCRQNLELCRQRMNARGSAEAQQSGPGPDCMGEFMTCLNTQQVDSSRCAGLN